MGAHKILFAFVTSQLCETKIPQLWIHIMGFAESSISFHIKTVILQQAENWNVEDGKYHISLKIIEKIWRNFKLSSLVKI